MARPIWSGAVSFGLVTIPVRLYSATSEQTVRFHQFERGTGSRIRYRRVNEDTGQEVDYGDIVKGYEVDDGRHVIVTPEELEAVEPEKRRTIDVEDFVDLGDIDPVFFNKTYYLAPAEDVGAEKPYALLLQAMDTTNKVAVCRFVMRNKEYLATIRPIDGMLGVETMFFSDEVRDASDVDNVPVDLDVGDRELSMAEQLVSSLTTDWDPTRYTDTYRERVLELIGRKAEGEEIVTEQPAERPEAGGLMDALRASVEAARQRGQAAGSPTDLDERRAADGAGEMSKEELYEQAQRADIPGRSTMTKEQLAEALAREAS